MMEIDVGILAFLGASIAGVFTLLSASLNSASSLRQLHIQDVVEIKKILYDLEDNIYDLNIYAEREKNGGGPDENGYYNSERVMYALKSASVKLSLMAYEIKAKEKVSLDGASREACLNSLEYMQNYCGVLLDDVIKFFTKLFFYRRRCAEMALWALQDFTKIVKNEDDIKSKSEDEVREITHSALSNLEAYLTHRERALRNGRLEIFVIIFSLVSLLAFLFIFNN